MADYNGNDVYLQRDGLDVSALFTRELTYSPSNDVKDVTAGAGVDGMMRAPGLDDVEITLQLAYRPETLQSYLPKFKPGTVMRTVYGPKTNKPGNPKFDGDMIISRAPHTINQSKEMVVIQVTMLQADIPISEIMAGDVF